MSERKAAGRLYECQECGLRSLEFGPTAGSQKTCRLCYGKFAEQSLGEKEPHQATDEVRRFFFRADTSLILVDNYR